MFSELDFELEYFSKFISSLDLVQISNKEAVVNQQYVSCLYFELGTDQVDSPLIYCMHSMVYFHARKCVLVMFSDVMFLAGDAVLSSIGMICANRHFVFPAPERRIFVGF